MAINKRKLKARKAAEPVAEPPGPPPAAFDVNSDGIPSEATLIDGSDLSWLEEDILDLVDDKKLHEDCLAVMETLRARKLDFGKFVWAVNYGNKASRDDTTMRTARNQFRGKYLVPTLQNIRIPPRTTAKGERSEGAQESIDNFALRLVGRQFREEMRAFEKEYGSVKAEELSEKELLEAIDFDKIEAKVHAHAPTLFRMLYMLGTSTFRRQRWGSNNSQTDFFVTMTVSCIAYQMSSANNTLQRLLGYYFHAKHVPKAVIEMLADLNLSVSYSSITGTLSKLSDAVKAEMLKAIEEHPFVGVYDNLRIKRAVRSQRSNNQTVTDNGTAMTVIILPKSSRPAWEDPEAVRAVRTHVENQRALGTPLAITFSDLTCPQRGARVLSHKLYHIFNILRAIPTLKSLPILTSPCLIRPPGLHELASGPDKITRQYMLGTRPIDESSYSGNLMVLKEFLHQLGWDTEENIIKMTLEKIVPLVGDDMTVARLRGLQWQRQEESNGYDRLDPFIFIFGWFHALMCLAATTFENHRGSAAGLGFTHSVLVLSRRGFSENMRQKRPDYHTVKEYLMHEFEARIRGYWQWVTGTTSEAELKAWLEDPQRTPEDIFKAGQRIQRERVSKQAVSLYEMEMEELGDEADPVFLNGLVQNRDMELFWDLRNAVKRGHVGHMEDLLPELLVFFTGGRNTNYAKQMYELLLIMRHESTPAIRHAIREHCFLVNTAGRPDSFYPIDQRQELNNAGIKAYGPPPQGGLTWEDYEKVSPLIPTYAQIVRHVEDSIIGIRRSRIHKDPPWERDLQILMRNHSITRVLTPVPGRQFATPSDHAKDYFKLGSNRLQNSRSLANYTEKRLPFFRSRVTTNDFSYYMKRKPPLGADQPPPDPLATPPESPSTSASPLFPPSIPPSPEPWGVEPLELPEEI